MGLQFIFYLKNTSFTFSEVPKAGFNDFTIDFDLPEYFEQLDRNNALRCE